jgi:bifunctional non-homologous end joining protein LigD
VVLSPVYSDGTALRAATVQRGLPGVLAKRRDAPYRAGPATAWVRVGNGRPVSGR